MKPGDKVRCIKTVIMQGSGEETFTEGKWYIIYGPSTSVPSSLINNNGQIHGTPTSFFNEHFTTAKRLVDVTMEKTGKSEESIVRYWCVSGAGGFDRKYRTCEGYIQSKCTDCWNQICEEEKPVFKPGDKAKVRSDLVVGQICGEYDCSKYSFDSGMDGMKGKVVTIKSIVKPGVYRVEEYNNYWSHEMLEPVNAVKCDSKDCENNDNGKCQTMYDELIRLGVDEKDVASLNFRVGCIDFLRGIYKKRNNDRRLWQATLDEKFIPVEEKIEELLGLLAPRCPLCEKYYHLNCAGCPWQAVFGRCVKGDGPYTTGHDGKFGELYDVLERALEITTKTISGIQSQIDKC